MSLTIKQRNDLVLFAWAQGRRTELIAAELAMSRNAVLGVVRRARVAGNQLAVSRAYPKVSAGDRRLRRNEYMRLYMRARRAEKAVNAVSYADGSAWA